jgi:hypothetical protein
MRKTIRMVGALAMVWAMDASAEWVTCAQENDVCKFTGRRSVQYGVGKQWFTKIHTGGVKCDAAHFGGDPAQGKLKTCRVSSTVVQEPQAEINSDWKKCASEGGVCKFSGQRRVAYGTDGQYKQRVFTNGAKCTNEAFGGDPVPGRVKTCFLSP